jgi:PHD/YefM family antitoxin component YafN of YafNO toxin-antitoxin module
MPKYIVYIIFTMYSSGMREIPAVEARKRMAQWLNGVQWQGQHVAITRNSEVSAVCVPESWYRNALAALAGATAEQQKEE